MLPTRTPLLRNPRKRAFCQMGPRDGSSPLRSGGGTIGGELKGGTQNDSRQTFNRLRPGFEPVLDSIRHLSRHSFVREDWARRNLELEQFLLPDPPPDFLRHPAIAFQMFVGSRYLAHEAPYVLARLHDAAMASEDPVGEPPRTLLDGDLLTSSNTVHHLHHLLRYEEETGRRLSESSVVVVEWGGGYGNLAKLYRRLHGGSPTYVLIDTPTFAAVQWLYLASILGEDQVELHCSVETPVREGQVNVIPLGLVDKLDGISSDLFISTWALNESNQAAQEYVVARRWFDSTHLLLGMHRGDPLQPHAVAAGCRDVPLGDFMPGQSYFIRDVALGGLHARAVLLHP